MDYCFVTFSSIGMFPSFAHNFTDFSTSQILGYEFPGKELISSQLLELISRFFSTIHV